MASQLSLQQENVHLRARVANLEEVLRAIHADEVDAFVATGSQGGQIVSSKNTDFVYRHLIEEMAQGALTLNAQGVVLYANRGFSNLIGRELNTVIGQEVTRFIAPEGQPYLLALLQFDEPAKRGIEVDLTGADGARTPVMLSISPMTLDGLPGAFSMVVTDLTAKKRTETEVQAREVLLGLVEGQKRAQDDLKANQAALLTSVNDKEALLKEVHHRVKNNLQVIISLLRMEARRSAVPEAIDVLQGMQGRIHSMALLHESLYRSGTFASVDLGTYLSRIASQAFQTQLTSGATVQLKLHMGSVSVGMDQAMACGLLTNELVANSVKHAFPHALSMDRSAEVCVELAPANPDTVQLDALWRLRVYDTGVGLPPDFEDKRKTSLGLQLVGDLAQQAKGTLRVASRPGEGAEFSIVFKALTPEALVMPASVRYAAPLASA